MRWDRSELESTARMCHRMAKVRQVAVGKMMRDSVQKRGRGRAGWGSRREGGSEPGRGGGACMAGPLGEGVIVAAIEAAAAGEGGAAGGAGARGGKEIERLAAGGAVPEGAGGRGDAAGGTEEAGLAGQFGELAQGAGVAQAAPTTQKDKGINHSQPQIAGQERRQAEQAGPHDPNGGGGKQAASAAEGEPEQGAEDLAAIERVDGEEVEDEQAQVDVEQGMDEGERVGMGEHPERGGAGVPGEPQEGGEGDVDQGAGGKAPEGGAGARGRVHEGDAAQGPENDVVGVAADLAAGEGVSELVQGDDEEEGEVLGDVPAERGVGAGTALDLDQGDEKPGPVQGKVNTGDPRQVDRPARAHGSIVNGGRGAGRRRWRSAFPLSALPLPRARR